ncbi:MAG: twin-arginine translocation signal domain-containing protein [Candidatus Hydrogenedentes bacterium]|nr:twin-arginine translocation signal domain-containing protein [Candidatus Hydrogenedentota bacterium]
MFSVAVGSTSTKKPNNISRRDVLKNTAAAGIASAVVASTTSTLSTEAARHGALHKENVRADATDWQLTYTKVDPKTRYRCPWIEGYCSRASVKAGDALDIFVSANPPGRFTIDIFRMGYYDGAGARLMQQLGPFDGVTQPDPPIGNERIRECQWKPATTITIPEDWVSGVYLGRLSLVDAPWQSYVVFIVRDERKADIVFQCSDNTWQAYNRWPDQFALYDDGKSEWALKPGIRVSYDRPYGKYCQILDAPQSQGSGEFLLWEFPFVYWLEREGYDVTYVSNTDVHAEIKTITRAKAMISVGHDEYWSLEQFNHVKQAIAEGLNVGFFSGNTCCFVSPMSPSSAGVPNRNFTREGCFGGTSKAEADRGMGPFPMEGPDEREIIGARTIIPFNGAGDWIVSDASHWMFDGTGMKNGDGIPGLVGWEFHGEPADIPGLKIVAEGDALNSGDEVAHWTATIYPGPKGNHVFNASTIWWAQGLSSPPGHMLPYSHNGRPHGPDTRVQRITHNLLKRFLKS